MALKKKDKYIIYLHVYSHTVQNTLMNIHAKISIPRHQNRYTETQNCKKYIGHIRTHKFIDTHSHTQ